MRSWASISPTGCETITNSMMFLGTLIPETKTIKLATGTSNLSHMHPVLVAQHAAMFDHLSQGRFIFGVSPGALTSDAEALGILEQDRNKMFAESIDVILAIWERDPPYDIDFPDNRYKVSTSRTIDKPLGIGYLGKPYPEAAAGNRRHGGGAVLAGRRPHGAARLPSAVGELPAVRASQVALAELLQGQGRGRCRAEGFGLARRAHHLRRRRRQDRGALRPRGCEQPVSVLLAPDVFQDEARQAALCVQEPQGPAGRRDHARLRARPLHDPRQRRTRSSTASWRCARRSAISARSSMRAWTGPIRRWRSAR